MTKEMENEGQELGVKAAGTEPGEAETSAKETMAFEAEASKEIESAGESIEERKSVLNQKLDYLTELFQDKIQTDAYKNRLLDQMHDELKLYQNNILESIREPIVAELIDVLEGMRRFERFAPEEVTEENYEKLKRRYSDARGDLEDILESLDVCRYETDPSIPDLKRQKIVKTVPTGDAALNNRIAKKISDGYMNKNKILKYEKVAVYRYQDPEGETQKGEC